MVGSTVSHYRILSVAGRGGMGEVYAAVDETLGRRVALKAIRADRRLAPEARARFLREAQILSRLDHPHICRIYDYIAGEESDFLVLELVTGQSLRLAMRDGLSRADRLRIAEQITSVLVAAHGDGIVHRDLKPENVMIDAQGSVKVLDFGLAFSGTGAQAGAGAAVDPSVLPPDAETFADVQSAEGSWPLPSGSQPALTVAGQVLGTVMYMSPEQAAGDPATPASDMFALGLILRELFAGAPAYARDLPPADLMRAVAAGRTGPVRTADADLTRLIERLESTVAARRPTAIETAERLRWIRDKPRRRLRRVAIAAVLLLAVLAAAKYTIDLRRERSVAVTAREEADRRRGQAEDLISFMLGDLRARLEPVGRLDLLDAVGRQASTYFAAVPESVLSNEELFRRSQALRQIGEVRTAQGSLAAAHDAFEGALRLSKDLTSRDPGNGRWQMGLAATYFWLGSVEFYRGNYDAAREPLERYLETSRLLVRQEPGNAEYRLELAYAHSNLGSLQEATGHLEEALVSFRATLAIKAALAEADPSNTDAQIELGHTHNAIGAVLEKAGDLSGAANAYRADRTIKAQVVARDPANALWRNHLVVSHILLGGALDGLGELSNARVELEAARRLADELVAQDPQNTDWRRGAATARRQLAQVLVAQGHARAALGPVEEAHRMLSALASRDTANADWARQLALAARVRGIALLASGRPREAVVSAREAVSRLERLRDESPRDRRSVAELSETHVWLGRMHAAARDRAAATAAWQRAIAVVQETVDRSFGADVAGPYARALIHLGDRPQAEAVAEALLRRGFVHREVLTVCREARLVACRSTSGTSLDGRAHPPGV
jgi:serine/threonine-protein kinase